MHISSSCIQRRRKQLRVAQQAYRRRKDTAIDNLQTRVQGLESGIEDLSQSFLSFTNLLLEADLLEGHPHITSELQKITRQCVSLAKQGQGCDDEQEQGERVSAEAAANARQKTSPTLEISRDWDHDLTRPYASVPPVGKIKNSEQVAFTTWNQWSDMSMPPSSPYQEQAVLPFGIVVKSPTIPYSTSIPSSLSPPPTMSPDSLMKEGQWTLSHRLVRECCQNGYSLLLNSSNDSPRIVEVFGAPLSITDRNRLLSGFYMALDDEVGDLIELKTQVLNPMKIKMSHFSPEMVAHTSRAWQLVIESGNDELLDASGVQRLLQEKGIRTHGHDSADASPHHDGHVHLNMAAFIKRELLSDWPRRMSRGY